jgi:hypothetical protein
MTPQLTSFASWLSSRGIHNRPITALERDGTERECVFVEHGDATPQQQNMIATEAKRRSLKIGVGDKGASFS